jgi:hypothetical protein
MIFPLFTARTEQPVGTLFAQFLATEVEEDLIFGVNEYKTPVRKQIRQAKVEI